MNKILLTLIVFVLFAGCSGYSVTGGPGKTVRPVLDSRVANVDELLAINSIMVAPLVVEPEVASAINGSENGMYNKIVEEARNELGVAVFPTRNDKKIVAEAGTYPHSKYVLEAIRAGVDGILVTRLHNYSKRRGSAIGADEVASVGFLMTLYRINGDVEVWRSSYFFQDKSLSENLFRIGQAENNWAKNGWVTSDKLFNDGVESAIKDLASRRMVAFSK